MTNFGYVYAFLYVKSTSSRLRDLGLCKSLQFIYSV